MPHSRRNVPALPSDSRPRELKSLRQEHQHTDYDGRLAFAETSRGNESSGGCATVASNAWRGYAEHSSEMVRDELNNAVSETSPTVPDFSQGDGLLPAIAQDADTGEVLMLAYMNAESFARTVATGEAVYLSRGRTLLWRKGEENGHTQQVRAIFVDCDGDTILLRVA